MTHLYIFNNNLRFNNNESLKSFLELKVEKKILLFMFNNDFFSNKRQKELISFFLQKLENNLGEKRINLNILTTPTIETLEKLISNFKIEEVYLSRSYDEKEKNIFDFLKSKNKNILKFNDDFLLDHEKIDIKDTFSFSYFKKFIEKNNYTKAHYENTDVKVEKSVGDYILLEDKEKITFDSNIFYQDPHERLKIFAEENSNSYGEERNYFDYETSLLSKYTNVGLISVKKIWNTIKNNPFRDQMLWREFAIHNFYKNPSLYESNQFSKMDKFPWKNDMKMLEKWKNGKTGYEIVDASMKQLNETGYISNRHRLIVSSFLTKNLFIHWKYGENYFREQLVDYSKQNNTLGWQWASSCGFNFSMMRVLNCELQEKRFNRDNKYFWLDKVEKNTEKIVDIKETAEEFRKNYFSLIKNS